MGTVRRHQLDWADCVRGRLHVPCAQFLLLAVLLEKLKGCELGIVGGIRGGFVHKQRPLQSEKKEGAGEWGIRSCLYFSKIDVHTILFQRCIGMILIAHHELEQACY